MGVQGVGTAMIQCPNSTVADWPTWIFQVTDSSGAPTQIKLPPKFYVTDTGDGATHFQYQPWHPQMEYPGLLLGTVFLNAHYAKFTLADLGDGTKGAESVSFMS